MTRSEHEAKTYRSFNRANSDLRKLRKLSPQHHWLLSNATPETFYISGVAGQVGCGYTVYATAADLTH